MMLLTMMAAERIQEMKSSSTDRAKGEADIARQTNMSRHAMASALSCTPLSRADCLM